MPILIIVGVLGILLTLYIAYRASISDRKLFSVSLLALFAGLLFESLRVSKNWRKVLLIFVGSYFLSLLNFIPGKNDYPYNFENHIESWTYIFLFFYTIFFAFFHKDKVTAKLTEGTTLLLSISLVYWLIDYGFFNYQNWFAYTLMAFVFSLTAFSLFNAFSNLHLSRTTRLTLSIWSSVIMFAFAIDNIFRVFANPTIESSYLSESVYIGFQFFLLGVSAVYIMQNYMLIAALLPSKNGNYKRELKEGKKEHIERFSDKQVLTGHSMLCILYSVIFYGLNYKYQIIQRHTMVWLVFFTFPFLIRLFDFIVYKRKISR